MMDMSELKAQHSDDTRWHEMCSRIEKRMKLAKKEEEANPSPVKVFQGVLL